MQRFTLALTVIGACLLVMSCATPMENEGWRPWMGELTLDADSPAETLARIAARERAEREIRSREVSLPPGVDSSLLASKPTDDPLARKQLEHAILEVTEAYPWNEVLDAAARELELDDLQSIKPAEKTAAIRHYIRGRDAAYEQRYFAAITELQQAREYDPHSPEILRELARSYLATGNQSRATETYVRLAVIEPGEPEALFIMALSAAARGDHELALATFGQRLTRGESFHHDPAADLIVTYILSESLRELGYDRAAIKAASYAVNVPEDLADHSVFGARVRAIEQQQGDLWRRIGDAHVRLGEYERALDAYTKASEQPMEEPTALQPRLIFLLLRLGWTYTAQHELYTLFEENQPRVSDRDVRLAAYVADHAGDVRWLRNAVLALYREHDEEPSMARLAASLMPPAEAGELLEEYTRRRPRDLHVVAELLAWLGARDTEAAVRLTATLVRRQPGLAGEYAKRLVFAVPQPVMLLNDVERLDASPERAVLRSRMLGILGAMGEAWNVATEARQQWPDEPMLFWLQVDLAALLKEPMVLSEVLRDSDRFDSAWTQIIRGRAHRALGQIHEAVDAGEKAVTDLETLDPPDMTDAERSALVTAMIELGMTYLEFAALHRDEREQRRWAREAVDLAERALSLDERRGDSFELLLAAYGDGGPLRDAQRFQQIAKRLYEHDSEGSVYMRADAQNAILRGQYDDAIERLLTMYENNPYDPSPLELLIAAWSQADRLTDALAWLTEQLEERPGNPVLLEHWVTVRMRQGASDEVVRVLQEKVEAAQREHPDTPESVSPAIIAKRLLENVYRQQGMMEEAFTLGEERLRNRPRGIRREVERAALYGGVERYEASLERLTWVARHAEYATLDQLTTAIAILTRMEPIDVRHDPLTVELVERTIKMYPESSPMQVYGSGLRALSRMELFGERFNLIAEQAARYSPRASGASVRSAMLWRDLAQALVDDGHALAAARALRVRMFDDAPLERDAVDVLGAGTLAAYAAVPDEINGNVGEEVVAFVKELAARERLPRLFAIEGTPTTADVLFHASNFFGLLGREHAGEELLRAVITIRPDHGIALNNLGYGRIDRGYDDEQTIQWIQRAFELEPDEASVIDTMGWLRYLQGQFKDQDGREGALTLIERSHETGDESSAEVLDHLGDVYWRLGKRDEAVQAWSEAADVLGDPGHREQLIRNLYLLQARGWGLLVAEPQDLYDQRFGALLERLRTKIDAAEQDEEPDIAPTFAEMDGMQG